MPELYRRDQLVFAVVQPQHPPVLFSGARRLRHIFSEARRIRGGSHILLHWCAPQPYGTKSQKVLLAYDLDTGKFVWKYPQIGDLDSSAGTMATATGLVFFGDNAQALEAVDAKTGKPLWYFTMGQSIHASPMSYAVTGSNTSPSPPGTDVFSFALP